eukprot:evm.model.scf_2298.2 EVM.evm.TU.scf_2298.2   scf_2298:14531-21144(-)
MMLNWRLRRGPAGKRVAEAEVPDGEDAFNVGKMELIKAAGAKSRRKQRGRKQRGSFALRALYPFSFYQREKTFRQTEKMQQRESGWVRVRRWCLGSWSNMFVLVVGNELHCHHADPRGASGQPQPPVLVIKLVAAKLKMTKPDRFSLKEANGPAFVFRTATSKEALEWMYKFQHTPGMYRCLEDYYQVGKVWGQGATCRVSECVNKCTGEIGALKIRVHSDDEGGRQGMYNELRILQILDKTPHPAIPKLMDYFFDEKGDIMLVEELMSGGELLDKIAQENYFSEFQARKYFKGIAEGIMHLHKNGIAHRDIKPSNIMLLDDTPDAQVKIVDYDLAKEDYSPQWLGCCPCGTTDFMAPEIVNQQDYTQSIDMWSLGCVLYVMLCGSVPFEGSEDETRAKIAEGKVEFASDIWNHVSESAKSMVLSLLEKDPKKRLSAEQVFEHPWIVDENVPSSKLETSTSLKQSISSGNLANLFDKVHRSTVLKLHPQRSCPLVRRRRPPPSWRNAWELKSRLSKITISLIGLEAAEEARGSRARERAKPTAKAEAQRVHFSDVVRTHESGTGDDVDADAGDGDEGVEDDGVRPAMRPVVSLPNLAGLSQEDLEEDDGVWAAGGEAKQEAVAAGKEG